MKTKMLRLTLLALGILSPLSAVAAPDAFNFDGVLLNDPTGTPMTGPVSLKFQVMDQGATCVLFEETHSSVTLDATGHFSAKVGTGSRASPGLDGGMTWRYIFGSPGAVAPFANCPAGVTLSDTNSRMLRVTVNGSTTLSPDFAISATPFATEAATLQGFTPSSFVSAGGGSSVAGFIKMNTHNEIRFSDASTNYVGFKAPASLGSNTIWSLPSTDGTSGQALTTNGAGILSWTTVGGGGGLSLSGGTMTGPIAMAGQNLNSTGNILMATSTSLNLGTYNSSTQATLTGGLSVGDAGKVWYNTTTNSMMYWNGTSAVATSSGGSAITSLTGDVTASGPGSVSATIAANAITTGKINNDAVMSAKLNSSGIAINRLVITDATTGAGLTYATCSIDEVLKWSPTGWICSTVSSLLPATGVTPGTYGSASLVPVVTVDSQGRITSVSTTGVSAPVTSVAGRTGAITLTASDIGGLGSAAILNAGAAANNLVQLNGSGFLPSVDGSMLMNVNAAQIAGRTVSGTSPVSGQTLIWSGSTWAPGTPVQSGGNSNGASLILGTNDSFPVTLIVNAAPRMTINPSGKVGIGTTSPQFSLDLGSTTDAILVPKGPTGSRPGSPSGGELRYNTTTQVFEMYQGGGWHDVGIERPHGMQVFTTSGTFTVPMGVNTVKVIAIGGGGGGCNNGAPCTAPKGGQGGAGYAVVTGLNPGGITVTIGNGGTVATVGSAGGNTTFGSSVTANGGGGAAASTDGTPGTFTSTMDFIPAPGFGMIYGAGMGMPGATGAQGVLIVEW